MYFVYVLECNDGTLYTGITTDLERRQRQHESGMGAKYTRARGAKRIVYVERKRTRSNAQKREAAIKRLTRLEKMVLAGLQTK